MPRRPQGLFCVSDDLATGFLHAADARGLVAGEDFHLIGFGGQVRGRLAPGGPLTTVAIPAQHMGRTAADLLLSRLAEPELPVRRVLLACDLVQGRTARPRVISSASSTGDLPKGLSMSPLPQKAIPSGGALP
jgi:DNA-binding LacI/PurR family transcriptional regulator